MQILSCIILFILCIIGLTEVAKLIALHSLNLKNDENLILIYHLNKSTEDVEIHLRSCITKAKWMGKLRPDRIILLDNGLNENAKNICELICKEYEYLEMMTPDEFATEFSSSKETYYSNSE